MTTVGAYLTLCKPRVVLLMLVTAVVGMLLASPKGTIPWNALTFGTLGIALASASGACINHLIDRRIDAVMERTAKRPIVTGKVSERQALTFAVVTGFLGLWILQMFVNGVAASLTFSSLVGYAFIYTRFLKRATPQNIVLGGLAGAMPPMLGWTAVTGKVEPFAYLLVLIIYVWTPPHFWALAVHRCADYAKAKIPMLPVTHGIAFTKFSILLYTILLSGITMLPYIVGMSGSIYLYGVLVLNAGFLMMVIKMLRNEDLKIAMQTFYYSIYYLFLLFLFLLVDHYIR